VTAGPRHWRALCWRGVYLSAGDVDGSTVFNPEAHERIEVAVDDVVPVIRLLAASRTESTVPAT
jgi:FMN reductase